MEFVHFLSWKEIKCSCGNAQVTKEEDTSRKSSASHVNSNGSQNSNKDLGSSHEPLVSAFGKTALTPLTTRTPLPKFPVCHQFTVYFFFTFFLRASSISKTCDWNADGEPSGSKAVVRKMDAAQLAQLVSNPGKKSQRLHVALWNLDRVDQRELPLDKTYHYGTNTIVGTGSGVTVYILDSGVRPSHREFKKWTEDGTRARYGYDFIDEDPISEDCDGHGTHVASTTIGRSVGIAKQAKVVAVRVLDCSGSGNISTTVAGQCLSKRQSNSNDVV